MTDQNREDPVLTDEENNESSPPEPDSHQTKPDDVAAAPAATDVVADGDAAAQTAPETASEKTPEPPPPAATAEETGAPEKPSKTSAAIQLVRANLLKGKIPDSVKTVMAGGTLPTGDKVPFDIMVLLACDKNEDIMRQARQQLLGFKEEDFLAPLHDPDSEPDMLAALVRFFSHSEHKIRSIFFDPEVQAAARKASVLEMPHVFAHYLAREIQRLPGGWIVFETIQQNTENKHLLIEKLLAGDDHETEAFKERELTKTQEVLIKNFNPIIVTKDTKMIFATGKTPTGEQLPAEIMLQLIIDNDQEIRSLAAMNLMDYEPYEIVEALKSERINKMILKALSHHSTHPVVLQGILRSPHINDATVKFLIEKDFSNTIEAYFRQLIANNKFRLFRQTLAEFPECAEVVVNAFYGEFPETLNIDEWIEKARLERQVRQLGLELEPIHEMEQHTFSLAQLFQMLPPENVARIGDIIHWKAAGGQPEFDRLFISLLDVDLLRETMGEEVFKQVVGQLNTIQSTALLKTWAQLIPHQGLSGKISALVYAFWSLGKKFGESKSSGNVHMTVVELFHFVWSLIRIAKKTQPTFSFFDLKTMFLGTRSLRFNPEEEENVTTQLLNFGFKCNANGTFELDMTQFFTPEEIDLFVKGAKAKQVDRELTSEEIEKVKKEIRNLTANQKMTLAKQAPIDVLRVLIHEPEPEVVLEALKSPKITSREALVLALNKTISPKVIAKIAENKEWMAKYPVKIALVNNPQTPGDITLGLTPELLQQDLLRLIQSTTIPGNVRTLAVKTFRNRLADLPAKERAKMAEKATIELVEIFMDDSSDVVQAALLKSPGIREGHIMKFIKRKYTSTLVLDTIAENPNWTSNYQVILGLVNHPNLSKHMAIQLLKSISKVDLKYIAQNRDLASGVKDQAKMLYLQKGG